MNNTLYLTADEQKLFDTLSEELKEGWQITAEALTYDDDPQHRTMRMQLMHLHDPKMNEFLENVKKMADNQEQINSLILETDFSDVSDGDLAELFFVLGPAPLFLVIAAMLRDVSSDEDIESISSMTLIRNTLLSSMKSS